MNLGIAKNFNLPLISSKITEPKAGAYFLYVS